MLLAFAGLTGWVLWANTAVELNEITVSSKTLPGSFEGYRIAQISDLHNAEIGKENGDLLSLLREAQPDLIALTGDLIDAKKTDVQTALAFVREAVKIAPCYYVTGNHEANNRSAYGELKAGLISLGVRVLEDEGVLLERSGETVTLFGVHDPFLSPDFEGALERLPSEEYTVLLSHRPEFMSLYAEAGADLVLSGHSHGGQFRLPFVWGVIAPGQGWFPKYDAGLYTEGETRMVVSRGIGNSIVPLRINNRPEIVLIRLEKEA